MSLTVIGTPAKRRTAKGWAVKGYARFSTTSLSGELPIDSDCNNLIAPPKVSFLHGPSYTFQTQLGAISATRPFRIIVPRAGVISRIRIVGDATSAAHASTILNWHIINLGATGAGTAVVVDRAHASGANTTDTDTGASATDLTAGVLKTLTLTATLADKTVAAGDVLNFAWTVTGGTAQTAACIEITISDDGGTGDEDVWVDEASLVAAISDQSEAYLNPVWNADLSPAKRSVTVKRASTNPKSAAVIAFEYEG